MLRISTTYTMYFTKIATSKTYTLKNIITVVVLNGFSSFIAEKEKGGGGDIDRTWIPSVERFFFAATDLLENSRGMLQG